MYSVGVYFILIVFDIYKVLFSQASIFIWQEPVFLSCLSIYFLCNCTASTVVFCLNNPWENDPRWCHQGFGLGLKTRQTTQRTNSKLGALGHGKMCTFTRHQRGNKILQACHQYLNVWISQAESKKNWEFVKIDTNRFSGAWIYILFKAIFDIHSIFLKVRKAGRLISHSAPKVILQSMGID